MNNGSLSGNPERPKTKADFTFNYNGGTSLGENLLPTLQKTGNDIIDFFGLVFARKSKELIIEH